MRPNCSVNPVTLQSLALSLLLLATWSPKDQPGVNSWPLAEQTTAARTPLTRDQLARIERTLKELALLSRRDPSYCEWLSGLSDARSIASEAALMDAHPGVRAALATGSLSSRAFVEIVFALVIAGMAHEGRRSGIVPQQPVPTPSNLAFYAANQDQIDRILALDPC